MGRFSSRQIDVIFLSFSPRKYDSIKETVGMKCQIQFSGKNMKNILKFCLLKCLSNMLNVSTKNVCNDELLLHSI